MNREKAIEQLAAVLKSRRDAALQNAQLRVGSLAKVVPKEIDFHQQAELMLDDAIYTMALEHAKNDLQDIS